MVFFVSSFVSGSDKRRLQTAKNFIVQSQKWCSIFENYQDPIDLASPDFIKSLLIKYNLEIEKFEVHETVTNFESNELFYNWINGFSQFKKILGSRH
ncbi:MAG: hypothetical protein ACRYGR_07510 [Janthinobacterium lividum]